MMFIAIVLMLLPIVLGYFHGEEDGLQVIVDYLPPHSQNLPKSSLGHRIEIDYTLSVDPSTTAGEPNEILETSKRLDGKTLRFIIGRRQVVEGLDNGVVDMVLGEKRTIIIPPKLGFYHQSYDIPLEATIRYEVECLDVQTDGGKHRNFFAEMV